MSLVVEAIARRSRALRWKTTSPVAGSTRIAEGARTCGGAARAAAGAPAATISDAIRTRRAAARNRAVTAGA